MDFFTFILIVLLIIALSRDFHPYIRNLLIKPLPKIQINTNRLVDRSVECLKDIKDKPIVEQLRTFLSSDELKIDSWTPSNLWQAHEKLSKQEPSLVNWFTVQTNLFARTIEILASPKQKELIELANAARNPKSFEGNNAGPFGCFALTEREAGVLSGLQVDTEISYSSSNKCLEIHTPTPNAQKEWISLVGEDNSPKYAVVIAKFRQPSDQQGKATGPICGCVVDIEQINKENGKRGTVNLGKMGIDQCDFQGNRLGYLSFDKVQIPVNYLLQGDCNLDENTGVLSISQGLAPRKYFWKVINSLLMGRILMTGLSLLCIFDVLHESVKHLINKKRTNHSCVSALPSFACEWAVLWSAHQNLLQSFDKFSVENKEIPLSLVNRINMMKGYVCPRSIEIIQLARQWLGGSAILKEKRVITSHNSAFITKLVEGDSDIMMQAYMRDVLINVPYVLKHTLKTYNFSTLKLWLNFALRNKENQLKWLQEHGFPYMRDAFFSVAREELNLDQYLQNKYTFEEISELFSVKI